MVRLWILGLLAKRPMHGYEIKQYLELSCADRWAGILVGSIYHAIKKLQGEGLIAMRAIEHAGNRTRAVYEITPTGEEEFRRLLRDAWRTPSRTLPSTMYTAISFLHDLPANEVQKAIDEQIAALEAVLAEWNEGEAVKAQYSDPTGVQKFVFENGREHFQADLKLLKQIRAALPHLPRVPWEFPSVEGRE